MVIGGGEHRVHTVPRPLHNVTAITRDCITRDCVAARQSHLHRVGSCSHKRDDTSRSVNKKRTAPEGNSATQTPFSGCGPPPK